MNDKFKIFILTMIVFLFTTNCKKEAVSISHEYIGEWRTDYDIHDNYSIIKIDNESHASYVEYGPISGENFDGICKIKNNNLYIGNHKEFRINQSPTSETDTSCTWSSYAMTCIIYSSKMKLDSIVYYRVVKIIE